jgi:hypothetical protein
VPPTIVDTNAVVASCVVLVPGAAVGAVGVPVNEGDAIVARKAISDVFVVILAVLDAIEFVFDMMLVVLAATEFVKEVILDVFAATDVGNVAMVDELTPPTLFTVGKSAVPPKSLVNFSLPLLVASASGV